MQDRNLPSNTHLEATEKGGLSPWRIRSTCPPTEQCLKSELELSDVAQEGVRGLQDAGFSARGACISNPRRLHSLVKLFRAYFARESRRNEHNRFRDAVQHTGGRPNELK
jgi:hypothetical protein